MGQNSWNCPIVIFFLERDQAPKLHETEVNYSINSGTEQFVFEYGGHGRMDEVTPSPFGG